MMMMSQVFRVVVMVVAGMMAGIIFYHFGQTKFGLSSVYSSLDGTPVRRNSAPLHSGSNFMQQQTSGQKVIVENVVKLQKDTRHGKIRRPEGDITLGSAVRQHTQKSSLHTSTDTTRITTYRTTNATQKSNTTTISSSSPSPSISPSSEFAVPAIMHYTWYHPTKLVFRFHHFISILSAHKHIKPKKIMFWYDRKPQGKWWMEINNRVPNIEMMYRPAPTSIFGRHISVPEHQTDIVRLEAVMEYGGIYTDLDVIILKSFDPLRKFNTTMGYETVGGLCNGIIISRAHAKFLEIWHDSYKTFNDGQWAYHSVLLPASLATKYPNLIHTEKDTLHRPNWTERDWLYRTGKIWNWSHSYAVHLWFRFHNVDHNPEDIKTINTTMAQLFRYIYYGKKDLIRD